MLPNTRNGTTGQAGQRWPLIGCFILLIFALLAGFHVHGERAKCGDAEEEIAKNPASLAGVDACLVSAISLEEQAGMRIRRDEVRAWNARTAERSAGVALALRARKLKADETSALRLVWRGQPPQKELDSQRFPKINHEPLPLQPGDGDSLSPAAGAPEDVQALDDACDDPPDDDLTSDRDAARLPVLASQASDLPAQPHLGRAAASDAAACRVICVLRI